MLAPASGQSWMLGVPVSDVAGKSGGLVKRGEGTVVLNAVNKAYTGVTRVEAGTLDMNGSTWSSAKIGGGDGAFANGMLYNPTIVLDVVDDGESWTAESVPVLNASMLSGRVHVDLGRTSENPLSLPRRSLVVARYVGAAPAVSGWRLDGTGIEHTVGEFVVDDEAKTVTVNATAGSRGVLLIVQ